MLHNGFYSEATQMINDELFQKFPSVREKRLKEFRKRIKDIGILPGWMLEKLRAMQDSFENGITLRARSSTNNEDLQGFNGAGLYESYSHYPDEGHFSKTAKQRLGILPLLDRSPSQQPPGPSTYHKYCASTTNMASGTTQTKAPPPL